MPPAAQRSPVSTLTKQPPQKPTRNIADQRQKLLDGPRSPVAAPDGEGQLPPPRGLTRKPSVKDQQQAVTDQFQALLRMKQEEFEEVHASERNMDQWDVCLKLLTNLLHKPSPQVAVEKTDSTEPCKPPSGRVWIISLFKWVCVHLECCLLSVCFRSRTILALRRSPCIHRQTFDNHRQGLNYTPV